MWCVCVWVCGCVSARGVWYFCHCRCLHYFFRNGVVIMLMVMLVMVMMFMTLSFLLSWLLLLFFFLEKWVESAFIGELERKEMDRQQQRVAQGGPRILTRVGETKPVDDAAVCIIVLLSRMCFCGVRY